MKALQIHELDGSLSRESEWLKPEVRATRPHWIKSDRREQNL
jgi:hypothetical protein